MIEKNFLEYSALKLEQLASRIATCIDTLSDEQIWLRSGENANAAGNLVLHLCGNVRQWIGAGVAGKPDIRMRDREFAARGGVSREDLKERLTSVIADACATIRELPPERLVDRITVQGHDVSVMEAIYHVVEHFSGHAGQIIFQTKALTQKNFGFYSYLGKSAAGKTP